MADILSLSQPDCPMDLCLYRIRCVARPCDRSLDLAIKPRLYRIHRVARLRELAMHSWTRYRSCHPFHLTTSSLQSCARLETSCIPAMDFSITMKTPPTPTSIDAVPQISEAVEGFCSSMENGRLVKCFRSFEFFVD